MSIKPLHFNHIIYCLLILIEVAACPPDKEKPSPPNILFIRGYDHTSQACGIYISVLNSVAYAPNISRLSEEGVQLMNVMENRQHGNFMIFKVIRKN